MNELTLGQRTPLFTLVKYQAPLISEPVFAAKGGWDTEITTWETQQSDEFIIRIPREMLTAWEENGFITLTNRPIGLGEWHFSTTTFVLRQEAIDYESYMHKPKLVRALVNVWRRLIDDVPSLIWGFIGGSLSGIITALVLKWLGALQSTP